VQRLLVVALLTACEPPVGSVVARDAGADDVGTDARPVPAQSCAAGWVTTDLLGPTVTAAARATASVTAAAPTGEGLAARDGGGLFLARLRGFDPAILEPLGRLGIQLVEPRRGREAVLALGPGADLAAALARGLILAARPLRPADKLPPEPPAAPADARLREGRLALFADARGRRSRRTFAELGLPLSRAGELAASRRPWVYRVAEERTPDALLGADLRRSTGVEEVQGFSLGPGQAPRYSGYSGQGVVVAVVDSGVDGAHLDLHALDATGASQGSRVTGDPATGGPFGPHGTAVASLLAGNGYNSPGFSYHGAPGLPFEHRGQAPRVSKLISIYKGSPWTAAVGEAQLYNHSYPLSYGTYNDASAFVDNAIHSGLTGDNGLDPPRPMVWAVGNTGSSAGAAGGLVGYYSAQAVAKNPLVVGATNANDDSFCAWSSHGPTLDGRIKPDLVAPGGKDLRPREGIPAEVDEIRLVASAASGAADLAWTFDADGDLEGWTAGPGLTQVKVQGGSLHALITLGGEAREEQLLRPDGGSLSRSGLPVDGSAFERLELRMRLQVTEEPGKTRWPDLWVLSWEDGVQRHVVYAPFDSAKQDGGWQTHALSVPASFGTVTALQIELASYVDGLVAAAAQTQSYQLVAGTSFSAPAVSGVLALLLEQLADERGLDLTSAPPWPSTLKALLVHTARDMVHTAADPRDRLNPDTKAPELLPTGPDFATGFGLVDALAAHRLLRADQPGGRKSIEQTIAEHAVHSYRVAISPSARPEQLRATLAWDDPPGSPTLAPSEPQLVNDLDLVAISPSGQIHGPWVLDPLPRNPQGALDPIKPSDIQPARRCVGVAGLGPTCEDHRNNVEQVAVDRPEPGWWTLEVRAHDVPRGPQRYSLVVAASCN